MGKVIYPRNKEFIDGSTSKTYSMGEIVANIRDQMLSDMTDEEIRKLNGQLFFAVFSIITSIFLTFRLANSPADITSSFSETTIAAILLWGSILILLLLGLRSLFHGMKRFKATIAPYFRYRQMVQDGTIVLGNAKVSKPYDPQNPSWYAKTTIIYEFSMSDGQKVLRHYRSKNVIDLSEDEKLYVLYLNDDFLTSTLL